MQCFRKSVLGVYTVNGVGKEVKVGKNVLRIIAVTDAGMELATWFECKHSIELSCC